MIVKTGGSSRNGQVAFISRGMLYVYLFLNVTIFYAQRKSKVLRLEHKIPTHQFEKIPMVQDTLGYMWIGKIDGINKYNGHEFKSIPYENIFHQEIGDDMVQGIAKNETGVLWIRSELGFVSRMNSQEDFSPQSIEGAPLEDYRIKRMLPDGNKIWMATLDGKLLLFDSDNDTIEHEHPLPGHFDSFGRIMRMVKNGAGKLFLIKRTGELIMYDTQSNTSAYIEMPKEMPTTFWTDIALDKRGRIWIGTTAKDLGILIYDPERKKFIQEEILSQEILQATKTSFFVLTCDFKGNIWLGTDPDGLFRIDPERNQLEILTYSIFDSNTLSSNSIGDLYEDDNRNLWIACDYGDINVILSEDTDSKVSSYSAALYNKPARVRSLLKSQDGSLWFGTEGRGILRVDPDTGGKEAYLVADDYSSGLSVQVVFEVEANTIWVATLGDGLWEFDKKSKKAVRFPIADKQGMRASIIHEIYEDRKDRVWVLTEMGFFVYSKKGVLLAEYSGASFSTDRSQGRDVVETKEGTLWISAKNGVYKFKEDATDLKKSDFEYYDIFSKREVDPAFKGIRIIDVDNEGVLWLVSYNGRLYSFDTNTKKYSDYTHITAIERISFQSVVAQDKDNIWLGAVNGLWRLNPNTGDYSVFSKNDGFLDSRFLAGSYKDDEGKFYFASLSGVNYFDPDKLEKANTDAQLVIEGIQILNEPALSVIPDQLTHGIANVDRIALTYEQSSFSIGFLALDDVLSPNYFYSYRLKGLDDNWVTPLNSRTASYTKVPDGTYEFQVRAGTEAGSWDIPLRTVNIQISPPIYRHPLAYLGYVLMVVGLLIALVWWLRFRRNVELQQLKYEGDRQLYQMKMDFFSKISHEIQTPLSLILIPVENMLQSATLKKSPPVQKRLHMISHNVKRLSRIVFELTAVRNKEIGKLKVSFAQSDLRTDLIRVKNSFDELADRKDINFTFKVDGNDWGAVYDSEKLEHVFYNLLSNAFKFTPKGGNIEIALKRDSRGENALISFTNTGAAISEKDQKHIFRMFYQGEEDQESGTGIGLALSKELMELHQGTIMLNSNQGITCFTALLPLQMQASEVATIAPEIENTSDISRPVVNIQQADDTLLNGDFDKTVLIVEDNFELRDYLKGPFGGYYNIILASDGVEGYQLAVEQLPHLIVSDIMMPKKNGITLAKELRDTKTTAHIPIILMTAEDNPRNRVSALRAGVIEYMGKPFSTNELLLKSHNIITRGERLVKKIKADLIVSPSKPTVKSKDEVFLTDLVGHIDTLMEDSEFRVDELSKLMHMSHSSLYRKCQALTGRTLVEFVRSTRIKKAAMYLTETDYSVADAAYVVGFNDVKYFSKCFKKELGKSPVEYKKVPAE